MFSMLFDFFFRAFAFVSGSCFVIGGLIFTYWAISSRGEFFIQPRTIDTKLGGFLIGLAMGVAAIYLGIGCIGIAFRP